MEMDTQSRLDWLVSKEVAVSEFERTLDGLVGKWPKFIGRVRGLGSFWSYLHL